MARTAAKWCMVVMLACAGCSPSLLRVDPTPRSPPNTPGVVVPTEFDTWVQVITAVSAVVTTLAIRAAHHRLNGRKAS